MSHPLPRRRLPARAGLFFLALSAALSASACGSSGRPTGSALAPDVIHLDEIQESTATNAYDLITQVRPNWFRGRGTPSFRNTQAQLPVVYLGDRRQGSLEVLRSFASGGLAELRFINATTATTRYGNGHAGGVIEVVLLRR